MKVAVVILNWNGKALLEQFLPSVVAYSQEAQIYVADNASKDDSVAYVKQHFPQVKIIQNLENGGFAKGYNDALQHVPEDLFILLNSDVEVTEGWLPPLVSVFDSSEVAAAQPKILNFRKRDFFEYAGAAGGFIDKFGYPYCRGRIFETLEEDIGQYNDTTDIFWATGACLAIRKDEFFEAGMFDEDFFAHQEEIDLCWRIFNRGKKIKAVGNSTVYHLGGGTLNSINPKKTFYNFRNSLYSLLKNVPGRKVYLILFVRLLLDGLAGLKFLKELKFSHFQAVIRAHFSFYFNFQSIKKKRKNNFLGRKYYEKPSVVWSYYIMGLKKYAEL